MSIKNKLKQTLGVQPSNVRKGKVTAIAEFSIFVSSGAGVREFQVAAPSSFRIGDQVKFEGNTYLGRLPPAGNSKVVVV